MTATVTTELPESSYDEPAQFHQHHHQRAVPSGHGGPIPSAQSTVFARPADTARPTGNEDASEGPVHVPGYGWVDWPKELLDAQARYLSFIHRPDRPALGLRMRRWLRVAPDHPSVCIFCGQEWMCSEGGWATAWLSPVTRIRGRRRGRHRGRATSAPRLPGGARRR